MEQKYFIAGLDLSALTEASQEQIMQAINGLEPLANIGVVVASATRPDITNNPEMINSLWLDITDPAAPVLKRYIEDRTVLVDADNSWESTEVAVASVTTAMLAARSSTGGVDIARLKANSGYTDSGNYYYVLRIAANGKDVEAVTLDTALSDGGGVGFNRISTTGIGTGKYLKSVAGALAYGYIDPSVDITAALNNRISAPTSIEPGTANQVLCTNAGATAPEWREANAVIGAGVLALSSINSGGASPYDLMHYSGSAWDNAAPSLRLTAGDTANSGIVSTSGDTNPGTVAGTTGGNPTLHTITHGLSTVPKLIRVVLVQNNAAADIGWDQNDEVDAFSLRISSGNVCVTVGADETNVWVRFHAASGLELCTKGTGAGVYAAIDETKWTVKVYAWK